MLHALPLSVLLPSVLFASMSMLLTPVALAQEAGERLWSLDVTTVEVGGQVYMSQPRVAPDGTVYLVTDSLYAISPGGEVLWTARGNHSYIDLGPDGAVYTSAGSTVYAYGPDGTERWRFTDPGGIGITTGPTVGPDGNLYAVSVQGGLGAFSLTPEGDLRWNVPGFLTDDGAEMGRVAFGPDNLYYADDALWLVEGCDAPYTGLVSITLDGELDWCRSISGIYDPPVGPVATLDGRALVIQLPQPGTHVQAYTPDGERDWTQSFLPYNIGVGPDNNVYSWFGTTLISLTADGEERWSEPQPINNFPWQAVVAPDTSAVVAGSVYGFGENGAIVAADPADGRTLWSLPVTGPSAGAMAPAAFSPDGAVIYVPVSTLSFDEPDALWAIQVRDSRPTSGEPAAPEAGGLALSPAYPNPFAHSATIGFDVPEAADVRLVVYDVLGRVVAVPAEGPRAAGRHEAVLDGRVLPSGVYVVRLSADGTVQTQRVTLMR